MKKTLLAGLVGGFILFVWSVLAWVILPLHEPSMHKISNEDVVLSSLQSNLTAKGVYIAPRGPGMSGDQASMDAYAKKMAQGPYALIVYDPSGSDPMMRAQMVIGLVLDILSAVIVAWFLARSTASNSSYVGRVAYCGMFGIFVSVFTHLMNWNWMRFPVDFTTGLIIDGIIGLLLAGLGIAAVIKPPKTA